MKMMKKREFRQYATCIIAFIVSFMFVFLSPSLHAETNAKMGISLSETEVDIGDTFNATIWLDGIKDLDGFKISLLEWTNGSLEVIDIEVGWWDWLWDPGNFFHSHITNIQAGQKYKTSSNKTACTITFKAVNGGICSIDLVTVAVCSGVDSPLSCTTYDASIAVYPFDDNDNNNYSDVGDPPPDLFDNSTIDPIVESPDESGVDESDDPDPSSEPDDEDGNESPNIPTDIDPSENSPTNTSGDESDEAVFPFFETISIGIVTLCSISIIFIYIFRKKRKQVPKGDSSPPQADEAGATQNISTDQDDGPIRVMK